MRRRTSHPLWGFGLWGAALCLVLYFNTARPSKHAFSWTTVRYITTADTQPESRGVCPGLAESSKPVLVVARVQADGPSTWIDPVRHLYHPCVYTADAPLDPTSQYLQVPANRGHEAMAYLTFIIDNYANIPEAGAVFVHGTRFAWHNDEPKYDNLALLADLNVAAAVESHGYHNMRCDWSAGTCDPKIGSQGSLETKIRAVIEPFNARVVSDRALPKALQHLFGEAKATGLGRADAVRSQCCAQFVVSRQSVWQHSRNEYVALRQWLLDGSARSASPRAAPQDDRVAGRILSYMWHILFVQQDTMNVQGTLGSSGGIDLGQLNQIACPRADECYCRLYGRCNLPDCQTPGRCSRQYQLPRDYKLPKDWAAKHS